MTRSLKQGEFSAASALAESQFRASVALGIPDSSPAGRLSSLQQVRESDGLGVAVEILLGISELEEERSRSLPGVRTALAAWALAEAGRLDEAGQVVQANGRLGFVDMPDDAALPVTHVAWVEAAVLVGDRDACRALFDRLLPYHDIFQVTGGWYAGSTARYLALLAATLGDEAEADRWLAQAIEDHTRARTPPWLARTRVDWAESLLRRGDETRATVGTGCGRRRWRTRVDGHQQPSQRRTRFDHLTEMLFMALDSQAANPGSVERWVATPRQNQRACCRLI